jgi:hypothetical protein
LALKQLTRKIRAEPEATGVVVGYYFKEPSPDMKRRIGQAKKFLAQSSLPQARYFVRFMPWSGERSIDPPEAEPKYPSVFILRISTGRQ